MNRFIRPERCVFQRSTDGLRRLLAACPMLSLARYSHRLAPRNAWTEQRTEPTAAEPLAISWAESALESDFNRPPGDGQAVTLSKRMLTEAAISEKVTGLR